MGMRGEDSTWPVPSGEPTRLEDDFAKVHNALERLRSIGLAAGNSALVQGTVAISAFDGLVAREARVRALVETFRTKSVNAGKAMVDGVFDEDSVLAERMQGAAIAHGEDSAALEAALSDPEVK